MVQEPEVRVTNRMGYWKDENGKRIYPFTPGALKEAAKVMIGAES